MAKMISHLFLSALILLVVLAPISGSQALGKQGAPPPQPEFKSGVIAAAHPGFRGRHRDSEKRGNRG
jgi:hypothetical protein